MPWSVPAHDVGRNGKHHGREVADASYERPACRRPCGRGGHGIDVRRAVERHGRWLHRQCGLRGGNSVDVGAFTYNYNDFDWNNDRIKKGQWIRLAGGGPVYCKATLSETCPRCN